MKKLMMVGVLVAAQIMGSAGAVAGPWEDGMAAYNRGDYVPAIRELSQAREMAGVCEASNYRSCEY